MSTVRRSSLSCFPTDVLRISHFQYWHSYTWFRSNHWPKARPSPHYDRVRYRRPFEDTLASEAVCHFSGWSLLIPAFDQHPQAIFHYCYCYLIFQAVSALAYRGIVCAPIVARRNQTGRLFLFACIVTRCCVTFAPRCNILASQPAPYFLYLVFVLLY